MCYGFGFTDIMSIVETDDNKQCNEANLETIETVSQEESVDPRVQVSTI